MTRGRSRPPRPQIGRNYVSADISDEQLDALDAEVERRGVTRTIILRWALAIYLGVGPTPADVREEVAS